VAKPIPRPFPFEKGDRVVTGSGEHQMRGTVMSIRDWASVVQMFVRWDGQTVDSDYFDDELMGITKLTPLDAIAEKM